jgi:hypothetical protein
MIWSIHGDKSKQTNYLEHFQKYVHNKKTHLSFCFEET